MPDASQDCEYRRFTLSSVQQGGEWIVTIWPTEVEQVLPDPGDTPIQGASREEAIERAKGEIDRLLDAAPR